MVNILWLLNLDLFSTGRSLWTKIKNLDSKSNHFKILFKLRPFGFLPALWHRCTSALLRFHPANISSSGSTARQHWLSHCIVIGWKICRRTKLPSYFHWSVHWNAGRKPNGFNVIFLFKLYKYQIYSSIATLELLF